MPDTRGDEFHENHVDSDGEVHEDRRRRLRRRPRISKREPAVYIGSIPHGTRVSDFKSQVRGHDVAPMRVMWRGATRHALLFFEHDSDVEDALGKLNNLEISGKGVKVQRSAEREYKVRGGDGDHDGGRGDGGRGDGNVRDRGDRGAPRGGGRGGNRSARRYQTAPPPQRRMRQRRKAPSVFIGEIPRGTRVKDLKAQVRGLGVDPLRVLWRGGAGHTFLFFVKEEEADDAMNKLIDLEVNDCKVRVERGGQRGESHGSGDDDDDALNEDRRPRQRRGPRRQRNRSYQEYDKVDDRPERGGERPDRGGERQDRRARRPPSELLPAIYIGAIPRGTRAGEFKRQVRGHDLAPFRLILRLGAGYAYLLFQTDDEVEDGLHKLENLEINGRRVNVDKAPQDKVRVSGHNNDDQAT